MKRSLYLYILTSKLDKDIVLNNICCKIKIANPIPNSIAEKIKKKKVKESRFKLSLTKPTNKTIVYRVIHANSAVNNKWIDELVLTIILDIIKKKKRKRRFKSPKNKSNKKLTIILFNKISVKLI